jgi:hypothetical protein
MDKNKYLHLISDSTGGTLNSVMTAALAQFTVERAEVTQCHWPLVRSQSQLDVVMAEIAQKPGLVAYTLVDENLVKALVAACQQLRLPQVAVMQPVIGALSHFLAQKSLAQPGQQHVMNEAYFKRIEAVDFALALDDGQRYDQASLEEADVIILGVSRTSKTPTSVYLANRGLKCANIPLTLHQDYAPLLRSLKKPLLVGLTIQSGRLQDIRKNRALQMTGESAGESQKSAVKLASYYDEAMIEAEITAAKKLFRALGIAVIDVTARSIEETAAEIIMLYQRRLHEGRLS